MDTPNGLLHMYRFLPPEFQECTVKIQLILFPPQLERRQADLADLMSQMGTTYAANLCDYTPLWRQYSMYT